MVRYLQVDEDLVEFLHLLLMAILLLLYIIMLLILLLFIIMPALNIAYEPGRFRIKMHSLPPFLISQGLRLLGFAGIEGTKGTLFKT
jgi:hypothetical protein